MANFEDNFVTIVDNTGKEKRIPRPKDGSSIFDYLQDGEKLRVSLMDAERVRQQPRSASRMCPDCNASGHWKDVGIVCPTCKGSGALDINGSPIERVVENTSNKTEGARGGAFGSTLGNNTDRATTNDVSFTDRYVAADAAARARAAGHRPGFYFSDAGKAHHNKMVEEYSKLDDEREAAWKGMPSDEWFRQGCGIDSDTGAGSPARNLGKAKPGQPCMTNSGERGVLNENLECVVVNQADSQRIKDAAYEEYRQNLESAYRNLKS
jgi:hypothetical protein